MTVRATNMEILCFEYRKHLAISGRQQLHTGDKEGCSNAKGGALAPSAPPLSQLLLAAISWAKTLKIELEYSLCEVETVCVDANLNPNLV